MLQTSSIVLPPAKTRKLELCLRCDAVASPVEEATNANEVVPTVALYFTAMMDSFATLNSRQFSAAT